MRGAAALTGIAGKPRSAAFIAFAVGGALALSAGWFIVAGGAARSTGWTVGAVENAIEDKPGTPVWLPAQIPAGAVWRGLDVVETDANGLVVVRSSTFTTTDGPSVLVCAEELGARGCTRDDDSLIRSVPGARVVITWRPAGQVTEESKRFWRTVTLVEEPSRTDWLPG
jgi:hypothetical protein